MWALEKLMESLKARRSPGYNNNNNNNNDFVSCLHPSVSYEFIVLGGISKDMIGLLFLFVFFSFLNKRL